MPVLFSGMMILLAPFGAVANTISFALGANPNQSYTAPGDPSENVGPYPGTLIVNDVTTSFRLFFCLDGNLTATFNNSPAYTGTVHIPNTQMEEEAAFLASWALARGAPSQNTGAITSVEGPITFAIWQVMGTLGTLKPDPAAQYYIQTAQYAYANGLITQPYLNSVDVLVPGDTSIQRFVAAVRNDAVMNSALPEPSTHILIGVGLVLIAVGWRKKK